MKDISSNTMKAHLFVPSKYLKGCEFYCLLMMQQHDIGNVSVTQLLYVVVSFLYELFDNWCPIFSRKCHTVGTLNKRKFGGYRLIQLEIHGDILDQGKDKHFKRNLSINFIVFFVCFKMSTFKCLRIIKYG